MLTNDVLHEYDLGEAKAELDQAVRLLQFFDTELVDKFNAR